MFTAEKSDDVLNLNIYLLQHLEGILKPMENVIDHWAQFTTVGPQGRETLQVKLLVIISPDEQLWRTVFGDGKLDVEM